VLGVDDAARYVRPGVGLEVGEKTDVSEVYVVLRTHLV
jgi:hypothetical protein